MEIYLVGGAVRDSILNLPVKEKDWVVVGANEKKLLEKGYIGVGKNFPVFLHPVSKEEYALARKENKTGKGHKGFSFQTGPKISLEEDLKRRDITINAIAKSKSGDIIDPFGGIYDIKRKLIRKVSDAFSEDPLRVFRVARFAAKLKHLNFSVEKDTLEAMTKISSSEEINLISKERIWQETNKALKEKNPSVYFQILAECGALKKLDPNLTFNIKLLNKASAYIHRADLLWIILMSSKENLSSINSNFGVPKKIHTLSSILKKLIKFHENKKPKGSEVLSLLTEVDALRRNERFLLVLKAFNVICKILKETPLNWSQITKELLKLKPKEGIKKNEISEYLENKKIKIIDKELKIKDEQ